MLFSIKLKKKMSPEELVELLNKETWTGGGKFAIFAPEEPDKYSVGYIVYMPCEDYRYAVSVSAFNCQLHYCRELKGYITSIVTLNNQTLEASRMTKEEAEMDMALGIVEDVLGNTGTVISGVVSGDFKKEANAKKLKKQLDKELKAFVNKTGI